MKTSKLYQLLFWLLLIPNIVVLAQNKNAEIVLNGNDQGFIPAWLVTGPIEFPLVGFGNPKDTSAIGEPDIFPFEGDSSTSILPEKEKSKWFLQSIDKKGFVDFNSTLEWNVNTKIPVKIWYSRAGYAFTTIISDYDKEALLTFGSNSQIKVYLNKEKIYSTSNARNALKDQDTIKIKLKKGANDLIVRVLNTHTNLGLAFFGMIKWEWGFFARLLEKNGSPISNVKYLIRTKNNKPDFNAVSTFYFKKIDSQLKQRIDVEINSLIHELTSATLKIDYNNKSYEFKIDTVAFGKTRHSFYIPEIKENIIVQSELNLGGELIKKSFQLKKQKKYSLHLMLLNHTDVGYTNPQPVCEELHCNTLDDVLKMCKEHPDFHWTIETTWQLVAYEKLRSKDKFLELIELIKQGRVALSPIYTNPFTGWVSEEEMLRSFDKALEYKNKYGITFSGAVYNDVPGQSWFLPQALSKAGVKFLAEGINEFYSDYNIQRNLPKVFKWEAADGSKVVTYLNEAYNEGKAYGLESNDLYTVEQMIWERINKLEARNYQPDIILINTSFSDNSILAGHQYLLAMKWNEHYEYPKFISSDVNKFTLELINSKAYDELPVLKGDWTSNWDIIYQGEFNRNKKARWSQHQLLSAEKLSTLSNLLDSTKRLMNMEISEAYKSLLQFSGHGSGLEFGYGSPEDNKLTMDYRENYVEDALLGTESVLLKALHRISKPEESLTSEGLIVFNTLSWKRDDLVEIQYPFDTSPEYDIIDAETNQIIPGFRKDHRQYFVARDLPSFGYKKYLLKPKSTSTEPISDLKKTANSIENKFYKITFDIGRFSVTSIIDKKSGKELINEKSSFGFADPTIEKASLKQNHSTILGSKISYEIIDESPVRITLRVKRENDVIETIEFSLLDGIDKVFVSAAANLEAMKPTKILEEYGLPFSFNVPNAKVKSEILGGYIEMDKDRLPGIIHDGVSLRRSASIFNDDENICWSTADARVIRIRKDEQATDPVIISNPVTNFPNDWNRHENLKGKIDFHYAFTSGKGSFDPAKTSMLGYELNTPVQIRKSWFRAVPSSEEYLTIDNKNIVMINLKSVEQGIIIRLLNSDSQNNQTVGIKSKLFVDFQAQTIDLLGNKIQLLDVNDNIIKVELKPGEFSDILIKSIHK
ncbi:MAG: hypothetical protein NTX22_12795 [Ignavibacteriales bacterium]|nr:hypothetical protein [Ignavibacteriales bacterium]